MRYSSILAGSLLGVWCAAAGWAAAQSPPKPGAAKPAAPPVSAEAAEFFEKHVRPVLAEKCFGCHGPKISQSGLRVDSLPALMKGMDGGRTALVPGDPAKSPLIQVLSHTGAVKMPPAGKLPQPQIDALTQWVKMGAPWPGSESAPATAPAADPAKHWAFQPVRMPAQPAVKNPKWVKSPVDAYVLASLEKKGITPSRGADRRTLIRRAYFDLVGMPPTAEEVEAFIADKSPTAFATVVDRLLADPRYGERWGRYWLDVARYADTKGYVFQEERRYPYAYTYRDWVIQALNEDMPYDRFLTYQIAGDQAAGSEQRHLAAMGFLTLGRRFLNNQADIIDDRLDVVFRGTQALTVGCARCHDHKFDPIPTADYYSLYGVFASSSEPKDGPLLAAPERNAEYAAFEKQLGQYQSEVDGFLKRKHQDLLAKFQGKVAESLLAARDAQRGEVQAVAQKYELPVELVRRWMGFLAETRKSHHPIFAAWHAFADIPNEQFAAQAPAVAARLAQNADPQHLIHPAVAKAFSGKAPASITEAAQRLAQVLGNPAGDQALENALDSIGGPLNIPEGEIERYFDRADRNQIQALRQKLDKFRATSPAAPPRAMVLVDNPTPVTPRIFKRGNPGNPGDPVQRHFLTVLSGPEPKPFQKGSGRLELAQAIASKDNPLTARVMVNRVWSWHFGQPLVRTTSDFGVRTAPPANPALLDFLAAKFMEDGWSLKKLHRTIMLSSTYQQVSDDNPASAAKDPDNSLFWRQSRKRLDLEAMRDSLLWASGRLDSTRGGAPVEITNPEANRRTVYGFIDRQNLPNLFRTFDFAGPDSHAPQRFHTTVPQQALFLMNSPFAVLQARALAARPEVAAEKTPEAKIQRLYRLLFARAAGPDEVALGVSFIKTAEGSGSEPVASPRQAWQYGYGQFDTASGRVKSFAKLPHFNGQSWQGGPELPDAKLGWVSLSAVGGHPGDSAHLAIRRWTAPADGTFSVAGAVMHPSGEGDGVRALVVSSRSGVLGTWDVRNGKAEAVVQRVELKKGDTLDFVIDPRANNSFDSFQWAPVVRNIGATAQDTSGEWNAMNQFSGPVVAEKGLSPWEKYAQVLLLSNEFDFVD